MARRGSRRRSGSRETRADTFRYQEAHPALQADDRYYRDARAGLKADDRLRRGVVTEATLLVYGVRARSQKFSRSWDASDRSKSQWLELILVWFRARRYGGARWTRRTHRPAYNLATLFVQCSQLDLLSLTLAILSFLSFQRNLATGETLRSAQYLSLKVWAWVACLGIGATRLLPILRTSLQGRFLPAQDGLDKGERARTVVLALSCR